MVINILFLERVSCYSLLWKVEIPCWRLKQIRSFPTPLPKEHSCPGASCEAMLQVWPLPSISTSAHTGVRIWLSNWVHAHTCTSHMLQATGHTWISKIEVGKSKRLGIHRKSRAVLEFPFSPAEWNRLTTHTDPQGSSPEVQSAWGF